MVELIKMKKIFFVFMFLFLVGSVSAWSYDDSYSYGDSDAYVEIVGNYPICDGIVHGNYCVGDYTVDVSYTGDKFYMGYSYLSYSPTSNDYGYSGIPSSTPGTKILPTKNGHPQGYMICSWDKDTASNGDWSWTSICAGYLVDVFPLTSIDCYQDSDCSSNQYCSKSDSNSQNWQCVSKINVYELKNNQCENIYIKQSEKTSNDYNTLNECESNILYDFYRLEDNQCNKIKISTLQKTSNDYNNVEECQSNLIYDVYELVDKYCNKIEVGYSEKDNYYQDVDSCQNELKNQNSTKTLIIIAIALIVSFITYAIFKRKRK